MGVPPKPPFHFRNKRWDKIFQDFLLQLPNEETKKFYYRTLRRFFLFVESKHGGERTPDKILTIDVEAFLRKPVHDHAQRAGKPLSPYSHNAYLVALKAFYAYLSRPIFEYRGKQMPLIKKGCAPTDQVALARCGDADRDMTEEEVRAFFRIIDRTTVKGKRDWAMFWALLVTGKRRREIVTLRRGDLERFTFEGGREGWRFFFRAKWRTEREPAEMHQSVVDAIADFHRAAGRDFLTMAPETPLFPGDMWKGAKAKPMALAWCTALFREYAKKAGIPPNVVTHSLRHESAWQRYLANGHDILAVRDTLGHRDVATTMRYIERRKKKVAGDPTAGLVAAKFAML